MILQDHLPTRCLDDNSVEEILIKLPVKTLMRFKCVSKRWQSLIQDPFFVKSHHTRSKKTQPPQLVISTNSTYPFVSKIFYSPKNEFEGGVAVHKATIPCTELGQMLKPIDGLFCCVNDTYGVTCIFNLGTRQITPWAQSSIPLRRGHQFVRQKPVYGFGFDPSTNNYKVLRVWTISSRHGSYEYPMERVNHVCEVFTVGGENHWRKIDEVPPVSLYGGSDGVYANGSIYWKNAKGITGFGLPDIEVIVAFNVGTEKFRVIPIPNSILGSPGTAIKYYSWLTREILQIDGHMALMDTLGVHAVKLWISDDDSYQEKKMTTNWTEETIYLHSCDHPIDVNPIEGTDEIIIKSLILDHKRVLRGFVSIYIYNRTTKSFRTIHITGIAPVLAFPYGYGLYIFHESLVPVQKPAAKEEKLHQVTSLV